MIVNAWGVVLGRRDHGEADRLCTIYTENLGKVQARFVGVNKPGRKMKALSEPMAWAEYRLYVSPRNDYGKVIGGQLIGTFPGIRADLNRTVQALSCCEMMSAITAERSPNPEKYELICGTLAALDAGAGPWIALAFGLRLLDLAGYGLPEKAAGADAPLWEELRGRTWVELSDLPWDEGAAGRLRQTLYDHAEAQAGRPLKTRAFADSLGACEVAR